MTATVMLEQASALRQLKRKKQARELESRAKVSLRHNSTENATSYTVAVRELEGHSNPLRVRPK